MNPDRPRLPDWDAWRCFVADAQSAARQQHSGVVIITIRLQVRDGLLEAWSDPAPQKWNNSVESWLDGQGLKTKRDS